MEIDFKVEVEFLDDANMNAAMAHAKEMKARLEKLYGKFTVTEIPRPRSWVRPRAWVRGELR